MAGARLLALPQLDCYAQRWLVKLTDQLIDMARKLSAGAEIKPVLSVVVPAYNEQGAILETLAELHQALGTLEHYELIVVDDGSSDDTGELLEQARAKDKKLKLLRHARNQGYGAALKSGIRKANAEWVAITDADGTYPNDRLPELLAHAIEHEADMVVGSRTGEGVTYPLIRRIPKVFLKAWAAWVANRPIPDINSGLRVMRRSVVERFFNILPRGFSFTTTITLAMMTNAYDVHYVPISYASRVGKSKIRPIRDTLNLMQLILRTGVYFAPLRVFMPLAFVLGLLFLASLSYDVVVLSNLTDKTLITFIASLQAGMFALLADMIDKRSGR